MAEQTNSSSQDRASSLAAGSSVGELSMSMISVSVWLYVNDNAAESTSSINRSIAFRLSFVTCVRVCTIVLICHTIIHSLTLHTMIVDRTSSGREQLTKCLPSLSLSLSLSASVFVPIDYALEQSRSGRCLPAVRWVSAPSPSWSDTTRRARSWRRTTTSRQAVRRVRRRRPTLPAVGADGAAAAAAAAAVAVADSWRPAACRRRPRRAGLPTAASRRTQRCRRT